MDHPPLPIAALTAHSKPTGYDANRSFKTSLSIAMKECDMGLAARAAKDVEQAFIHFTKAYILLVDELPTHPRFVHLEPYKQEAVIGRGKEVDIWRSEVKVAIKKRVWEWEIQHPASPTMTRPRVQSESGVSQARSSLKPTPPSTAYSNSTLSENFVKHSSAGGHKRASSDADPTRLQIEPTWALINHQGQHH
ncbi:tyrosine kinase domain protein, putative, partial [Rhizoctonia solani AG-3 Rhs1AP]